MTKQEDDNTVAQIPEGLSNDILAGGLERIACSWDFDSMTAKTLREAARRLRALSV